MPSTPAPFLTERALGGIMPGARPEAIAAWIGPLREHMAANAIDTLERMAGFLASTANETGCLQATVEMGWFRTPWERAQAMFGFACPPRAEYEGRKAMLGEAAWNQWFFNHVYDDRIRGPRYAIGGNVNDGDGWRYRGRGVGITGRDNYRDAGRKAGLDLENNPDLLLIPANAALTFARMWRDIGNNERMDRGDYDGAILVLNSGLHDLTPHRAHYARTLKVLRAEPKPAPRTPAQAAAQVVTGKTGAVAVGGAVATTITTADAISRIGEAQATATAAKGFLATIGLPSPYTEIALCLLTVAAVVFVLWRYGRKLLRGEAVST